MPSHPSPGATLVAASLTLERAGSRVLSDVSCTVGPGTRLGVVGPNGAGKSTLLQLLAGQRSPDAGRVELLPPSATVGLLAQEPERSTEETVAAQLDRRVGAAAAEAELEAAAAGLARGGPVVEARFAAALERHGALGVDTLAARRSSVLAELGLGEDLLERPTAALSGGQAAKVGLAAVLLSRHDVLLLDEPTNDLDFEGLDRLEQLCARRSGGLVVVSHDRAFLERVVTSVLELDEHDHTGRRFDGGWAAYRTERLVERRHREEAHAEYVRQRDGLGERARREREWATSAVRREQRAPKDGDKLQRGFRVNRTEQLAQRARRTERAIERLDPVDKPWEGWQLQLDIGESGRSGDVVARLEDAVVARGPFRLGPVDLEVTYGERLRLAGPNGAGKTTLVRALLGELPLVTGRHLLGRSVVSGTLGQDRAAFSTGESALAVFSRRTGLEGAPARSLLAKLGLGAGHVQRPGASLSPGERTRAELAVLQGRGVNLLVLDEPTNHLDLPAIEQLEAALERYAGTLVLVSHDRRLLEAVAVTRVVDVSTLAHGR